LNQTFNDRPLSLKAATHLNSNQTSRLIHQFNKRATEASDSLQGLI